MNHIAACNPNRTYFSTEHGVPSQHPQDPFPSYSGRHFTGLHNLITSEETTPPPEPAHFDHWEEPSLYGTLPPFHAANGIQLPEASYSSPTVWR